MSDHFEFVQPLRDANFGGMVTLANAAAHEFVEAFERQPQKPARLLARAGGLLFLPGMDAMVSEPELLVRLSRVFGGEVENYRHTLTPINMVHETVPEIFIVSNIPPVNRRPPRRPEPPLTTDGALPTRFPHRRGWHTDQSYRRPPPDISLFLAVSPVTKDQGQTLFADAAGAHEQPQRQPVVRVHPVTGRRALYLCEYGQMDWLEGPFAGLSPGPRGEGAALPHELMTHLTQPEFLYVHEWSMGDLIVWDNRCLVHAATWFDAATQSRVMWRTTVSGNPGAVYDGERKSWIVAVP